MSDVNAESALTKAMEVSRRAQDSYLACAEYDTADGRTAANAAGAWAFWADIDCGEKKAAEGKGYADIEQATVALKKFCHEAAIPMPTIIVNSGSGIHVYWVLAYFVSKDQWQDYARKFKAVTAKLGFLADPSRTADIASVLRIPGTQNHKYEPPKPVTVLQFSEQHISNATMFGAIDHMHTRHCGAVAATPKLTSSVPTMAISPSSQVKDFGPLDVEQLKSAYRVLDPDCDDFTWKFHRIGPLAREAKLHPEKAPELKALSRQWSSGELRGKPSKAWTTPGATSKLTGEQAFEQVWNRFMTTTYEGREVTVGTVFKHAAEQGWRYTSKSSAQLQTPAPAAAEPATDTQAKEETTEPLMTGGTSELQDAMARMDKVIAATKDDVGAPFEPEAMEALAIIRKQSLPQYQRVKYEIKQANKGVSMVALESTLKSGTARGAVVATHHGYAQNILEVLTVRGYAPVAHDGKLYVLDASTSIWIEREIPAVEKLAAQLHDGKPNCHKRSDYSAISQHVVALASNATFFADATIGVATTSGFYRIDGDRSVVEPLTPEHRQRVMLPFAPKYQAIPLFYAFLHETFQSQAADEEAQQIDLVQEISGAIMLGVAHRYQQAYLYHDPFGRAGKGTLEQIQRGLVPPTFVTAVSPFNWQKEYYVVTLAGARLNVVGELPDNEAIPAAMFKSVLGGDLITGRNPTHRPVSFKNEAAHLFMSNHMINTRDNTEAFFARWKMVEFPNSRLRSGLPLDPHMARRIIDQELPGIAYWALQGAARLLKQGGYSPSIAHDRLMQKWRRTNSSLEEFINDSCDLGVHFYERRSEFYREYKVWCTDNGRLPFAKARVKDILAHNIGLGITHVERDGYETFKGVQVKEACKTPPKEGFRRS